ncbi:hypothetical protein SAXI111661_08580 [Saccharomonospora xinjiangensis]|uniref:hypothetical protein n=1 Tax=Saccharomonospora xinjiangensis TaxID=75294 RepID=UPI00106F1485|nr:hypothetical protein [Saccharomonospora xinjiangensis]QBQ61674.1 hypothetical protein EYD13_16650 [Saccharomonospora xinjiangensis]
MKKLSVVVTCTDRKMFVPSPVLRAGSLPAGPVSSRIEMWIGRVRAEGRRATLSGLYKGEHWRQAQALVNAAARAGFDATLWVVSAGLGLQPITASFPAYAATFSPGHEDSVASTTVDRRRWWEGLQERIGASTLADLGSRSSVLLVLSEVYGSVLAAELRELGQLDGDTLLVGGSQDIPGVQRIRANGSLRKTLGGTFIGLNARMANSWLAHCEDGVLTSPATTDSWTRWVERSVHLETYNRMPMTDTEVKAFIRASVTKQHGISRTRLHRLLRESGRACEQKRFAKLYSETVGEQ